MHFTLSCPVCHTEYSLPEVSDDTKYSCATCGTRFFGDGRIETLGSGAPETVAAPPTPEGHVAAAPTSPALPSVPPASATYGQPFIPGYHPMMPPKRPGSFAFLFSFSGRISRLWWWLIKFFCHGLLLFPIYLMGFLEKLKTGAFAFETPNPDPIFIGSFLVSMVLSFWISLSCSVKRWHDRGKSGFWIFINLIPIIGFFWSLIELGFLRGTRGPNLYGWDPEDLKKVHKTNENERR